MTSASQPIGVFDSGIGGLTVANAIVSKLPNEEIIYFGDTAHLPYGDKSADAIRYYCLRISKFLLDQGCKMIPPPLAQGYALCVVSAGLCPFWG